MRAGTHERGTWHGSRRAYWQHGRQFWALLTDYFDHRHSMRIVDPKEDVFCQLSLTSATVLRDGANMSPRARQTIFNKDQDILSDAAPRYHIDQVGTIIFSTQVLIPRACAFA
jgi:hypothetical protein